MTDDFSNVSVMVVEDQRPIRGLLVTTLRSLGVGTVIGTYQAEEAKKRICSSFSGDDSDMRSGVSAILIDIFLGEDEETGLDLAEWIRENPNSPNQFMPILMFSALASINMVQRSRDLGVNIFMRKPFAVSNLASLVLGLIRDKRSFIKTKNFFGPDRRRSSQQDINYKPERRKPITSNSDVEVFKQDQNKGFYKFEKENISRAESVFNETTQSAIPILENHIKQVQLMHQEVTEYISSGNKTGQVTSEQQAVYRDELVRKAEQILDDMVGVCQSLGVFRLPVLSQISYALSEFLCHLLYDPIKTFNRDSLTIIEQFVHFMMVVMKNHQALDSSQGSVIMSELEKVGARFKRKYNVSSLSSAEVDQIIRQSAKRNQKLEK